MNPTTVMWFSVAAEGMLLASRVAGSMFMPSPGLKMLATNSPISMDRRDKTRK